uniref:Succinate-semialdehyde dehydrogenase, mitochondrial n=1 Tax=Biomphalaria glabrata TaxID=6526 RepID=A0A2C9JPM9_BIOGL
MSLNLKTDKAFVDGKWISASSGKTYEVLNPATGQVLGSVPDMDQDDVRDAIKAAHTAFKSWKNTLPKVCLILFHVIACCVQFILSSYHLNLMRKQYLTVGKPLAEAEGEILYGSGFLEWFGEECRRTYGDVVPSPVQSKRTLVIKQPIGVAGMITPWNFPNAMVTRKAGAAIAAGCTVVLRPAEDTPFSALALCKLAEEAGLPPGVLNVVTSDRGNAGVVFKINIKVIKVINMDIFRQWSQLKGPLLLSQSADTVKKVSLELGGNAPFIVFDSADLQKAVNGLLACKFRNAGQTCVCANRVLVQEGIYAKFVHALALAIENTLKTGNGLEPGVNQGPLINSRAVEKVKSKVIFLNILVHIWTCTCPYTSQKYWSISGHVLALIPLHIRTCTCPYTSQIYWSISGHVLALILLKNT